MWCPQCKRVFDDGATRCDECGVRLVDQLVTVCLTPSMVQGMEPEAVEAPEPEELPYPVRRRRAGRRRVPVQAPTESPSQPFDDAELLAAMEEFETVYGITAEEEDPAEPVSPSGYQMLFVFLAIFAALAVAAWLLS
ncbi:hypothetical protein ACTQ33_10400 [Candidatus Avoscillospira sp. LCP25S3_F1]|uniref:hypothetical protein n=1 Tax=Candidatus Avoscillospira sp. LCP25S3_F1 TaxID=3438825 RepID=UPI003F91C05A